MRLFDATVQNGTQIRLSLDAKWLLNCMPTRHQEIRDGELPALPEQTNLSIKTQRHHRTRISGDDLRQALSLPKLRLPLLPLVPLCQSQYFPPDNFSLISLALATERLEGPGDRPGPANTGLYRRACSAPGFATNR